MKLRRAEVSGSRKTLGQFQTLSKFAKSGKSEYLRKEVAKPGRYQDMYGNWVEFVTYSFKGARAPEGVVSLPDLCRNTQRLLKEGFRVCAYSEHETNDSRNVLGVWDSFSFNGHSIVGLVRPLNKACREIMMPLDSSMIVEDGVIVNGLLFSPVITRCDVVGQGAIVGTAPFKAFRFRGSGPEDRKEIEMKRSLVLLALARAFSMGEEVMKLPPEAQETAILAASGLEGKPEEEVIGTLAGAFEAAIEEAATAEAVQPELETPEEMAKEIEMLREEKLEAAFAEVSDVVSPEEKALMLQRFRALSKAAGFRLAFDSFSAELSARKVSRINGSKSAPQGVAPLERKNLLKLARKERTGGRSGVLASSFAKMGYKARKSSED